MARILIDGRHHFYRLEGEHGRPVLVLAHPVGADHGIWDAVIAAFTSRFQVLRYDLRGHGASDVAAGDYSIAMLAGDMVALTRALGIGRFAIAGISLGALAALSVACMHPERVEALVLSNTAARLPLTATQWNERMMLAREHGMETLAGGMVQRMFSASCRASNMPLMHTVAASFRATPLAGYLSSLAALRDADLRGLLAGVRTRTLVIGAANDAVIPLAHTRLLAAGIPRARLEVLPGGHLTPVEAPEAYAGMVMDFLLS